MLVLLLVVLVGAFGLSSTVPNHPHPSQFRPMERRYEASGRGEGLIWSVLDWGADPNATRDSTKEIGAALAAAAAYFVPGRPVAKLNSVNRGGLTLDLMGGTYLVSSGLDLPTGGFRFCCGSLVALPSFSGDYMLRASGGELLLVEDVSLDANHTTGGVLLEDVLRATLRGIYLVHFSTVGVEVQGGHEALLTGSWLGEWWWSDPERGNDSVTTGTAVLVAGQDHRITDTIVFSGREGIRMRGGAALLEGVHVYNGGAGPAMYLEAPYGSSSNRILGCYLDGRGIVVEAPLQGVSVTNSFFLNGAGVMVNVTRDQAALQGFEVRNNIFRGGGPNEKNITAWVNDATGSVGVASDVFVRDNAASADYEVRATRFLVSQVIPLPPNATSSAVVLHTPTAFFLPSANFPPFVVATTATHNVRTPPFQAPLLAVDALVTAATDGEFHATLFGVDQHGTRGTAPFPNSSVLLSLDIAQFQGQGIG